jgi:hypothetical protein
MNLRATALFALVFAALAAGCAADAESASSAGAPTPQREYRTGSNIPVRERRQSTPQERAESQKGDGTAAKTN